MERNACSWKNTFPFVITFQFYTFLRKYVLKKKGKKTFVEREMLCIV
jgi:hypothetical protein